MEMLEIVQHVKFMVTKTGRGTLQSWHSIPESARALESDRTDFKSWSSQLQALGSISQLPRVSASSTMKQDNISLWCLTPRKLYMKRSSLFRVHRKYLTTGGHKVDDWILNCLLEPLNRPTLTWGRVSANFSMPTLNGAINAKLLTSSWGGLASDSPLWPISRLEEKCCHSCCVSPPL